MAPAEEEQVREIEQEAPLLPKSDGVEPDATQRSQRTVTKKVPEAEVHLYRQGKGPIDVVKMALVGWDQDQLDVGEILDKYGFKSVYAFVPGSGRGVPIRFMRNGRSLLTYRDGLVIYLDGEPKDPLLQPITKIIVGVAVITLMIMFVVRETPDWAKKLNFSGSGGIPPWILACAVVVFTRLRKRTRKFLERKTQ